MVIIRALRVFDFYEENSAFIIYPMGVYVKREPHCLDSLFLTRIKFY